MPINIKNYVEITSSVGGTSAVGNVNLMGRIFVSNNSIPPEEVITFSNPTDVGHYFGFSTQAYERAVFYFGWINKLGNRPKLLSYARWVNVANAPLIYGYKIGLSVNDLKLITNGSFTLTIGTTTNLIGSLDFSTITTYADAAAIIQSAINAETGLMWTAATVVFDAVSTGFDFTGGDTTTEDGISVSPGTVGTDIATIMGWFPKSVNGSANGAIWSRGAQPETVTDALDRSLNISNNFGSFVFQPALTDDQIVEAATWNNDQNVLFQFMVRAETTTKAGIYGNPTTGILSGFSGAAVTYCPMIGEYDEQAPMMILAATDYFKDDSVQNFMFQQFNLTPKVTDTTTANLLDSYLTNYYGLTQQAGTNLAFYQRGYLMGLNTAPRDMNVYGNEQWLKQYITSLIMNAFLSLPIIPSNDKGRAQLLAIIQTAIDQGLANGTIRPGQTFNIDQINAITTLTGDNKAYYQVQAIGYWINVTIVQVINPNSQLTEYQGTYLLIYAKDNAVRKVVGTHILI